MYSSCQHGIVLFLLKLFFVSVEIVKMGQENIFKEEFFKIYDRLSKGDQVKLLEMSYELRRARSSSIACCNNASLSFNASPS